MKWYDQIGNNGVFNDGTTWYAKSTDNNNIYQLQTKPDEIAALLSASGSWSRYWTMYPKEMGNTVSSDLNTVTKERLQIFLYNADTLNSPYKQSGLSAGSAGIVFSYANNDNFAVQLALSPGGPTMYIRYKASGTWSSWSTK